MEAPEKIYLTEDNPLKEWYRTKQVGFNSIEYTRTDAFIDKAIVWLQNNILPFDDDDVEEFKNYMKGL